jgi:hypothetical protein
MIYGLSRRAMRDGARARGAPRRQRRALQGADLRRASSSLGVEVASSAIRRAAARGIVFETGARRLPKLVVAKSSRPVGGARRRRRRASPPSDLLRRGRPRRAAARRCWSAAAPVPARGGGDDGTVLRATRRRGCVARIRERSSTRGGIKGRRAPAPAAAAACRRSARSSTASSSRGRTSRRSVCEHFAYTRQSRSRSCKSAASPASSAAREPRPRRRLRGRAAGGGVDPHAWNDLILATPRSRTPTTAPR